MRTHPPCAGFVFKQHMRADNPKDESLLTKTTLKSVTFYVGSHSLDRFLLANYLNPLSMG